MSADPQATPGTCTTIEPDLARGFVRIRARGRLAMNEAQKCQAEVAAAHPRLHRLWDFREADLSDWSGAQIRAGIDAIAARTSDAEGMGLRVASLVANDLDFGVSRMFESMAAGALPMRYAVFRDEARAVEWLLTGE
jgi:hypothetical protein